VRGRPYHVATALDTRGGIAAVLQVYERNGLFNRWHVRHVVSHTDRGGTLKKVAAAIKAALLVWAGLAQRDIALLHVHTASGVSFLRKVFVIAPVLLLRHVPIVLHVHGGGFADYYERSCTLHRALIRAVLNRAQRVIALTNDWAIRLATIAPAARIEVLVNPVEIPPEAQTKGETSAPRRVVLFLGLLDPSKGSHDLLRAFAMLPPSCSGMHLVLAGSGDVDGLKGLAELLGVNERVTFPGWINPIERTSWLRQAICLALPSYAEGLPMAVLEAMAMAVPVIATAVGGIPQVVRPKHTGWLIAPGDITELSRCLANAYIRPDETRQLGQAARRLIETEYGARAVISRLESVYTDLGLRCTADV
jgi:glycosyltransferase involved in cell wall biosynthesis